MWSQRQRNKAFYCNNTSTGMRFIDQQIHTQQPGRCKMCRCGALLNKYLRRGDVADPAAEGGAFFFSLKDPDCVCFYSKGLKTDKLPAHLFEIDEDAKDEVSRGAAGNAGLSFWPTGPRRFLPGKRAINAANVAAALWVVSHSCGQFSARTLRHEPAALRGL